MTNREIIPCPLCNAKEFSTLYKPWNIVNDPGALYGAASGLRGTQEIVRCNSCDLIYENPRYSKELILKGYEQSLEGAHDSQYPMRVRSFLNSLKSLKDKIPKPGSRILDIGTAGGGFIDAATQYGYDAYGLEPSQFLVDQACSRGLKVRQGTIDTNPFSNEQFDMITLWDVIEHLTDPLEDLRKIHKLLIPGGILLINYPDIGTWAGKLFGKKFWWILSVHLVHFDQRSIREICKQSGFETFLFQPYWQILEFGYLEKMAAHLGMPGANFIHKCTPQAIRSIPLPYWASQTTSLSRKK